VLCSFLLLLLALVVFENAVVLFCFQGEISSSMGSLAIDLPFEFSNATILDEDFV
jgi:hypothetical protein